MVNRSNRRRRPRPVHQAADFGLAPLDSDSDMFAWFLLAYLFGKPIQSTVAINTWRILRQQQLDTPWAILEASDQQLVRQLRAGGYTRYQHVMTRALKTCMQQLVRDYDGSVSYLLSVADNEDILAKLLQKLYGVGPKTAEIFMRETTEYFARRIE